MDSLGSPSYTEVVRTETRLEAENFGTRVQVARVEGEFFRAENEVSRLAGTVESLSFRLSAEREAREVEDRSLRECVEDLVEALKENMAKLTTDMENIKITVREESHSAGGRAQRQCMEMIDGQLQPALKALEDRLREEMRRPTVNPSVSPEPALKALEDRLREEMRLENSSIRDAHRTANDRLTVTTRTALDELEARLREDMRNRGSLDALSGDRVDRAALESLESKWRQENDRVQASHRVNFENLGQDIVRFNSFFEDERSRQRSNLEELEAKLRGEVARTSGEMRAELADGSGRGNDGELKAQLEALDARLMDELSGQHGRLQGLQRSSLQALEADIREELARLSGENSKSHSTLRDLFSEHRSEIDSSYSRINNASRLAIADVDAKVEELRVQSLKIESLQRAAIQTLGEELRDEMVRSQRGTRGGGLALEDVDARFETHAQRVEAQLRRSSEAVDENLRVEIGRMDGEHRARHSSLQEQVNDLGRRPVQQAPQAQGDDFSRQDMEQLRSEVEDLLSECRRLGSGPPPAATPDGLEDLLDRKFASLVEGLSSEDAEGRRWFFHDPRDCLAHVTRRLKELDQAVGRERQLREESIRMSEVENMSLKQIERTLETDLAAVGSREVGLERRVQKDEAEINELESRLSRGESQSQRFADRLQQQDEDSLNADMRSRRNSRGVAEDRGEQQLRQLRSEQSTLRRVESELAVERELERERGEQDLENLESDLQGVGPIPRISVTDVGLSSSVASSVAGSLAGERGGGGSVNSTPAAGSFAGERGGGGSVSSTPATKTLASSSRSTPLTQSKRTTTTRSVSPSQRTSTTLASSRSAANGVGGDAPASRGSSIVAGPAQSARTSASSAPLAATLKAPERAGGSTLKSRMAGGSSRPSASPVPGRPSSTLKGSVRARPAT